MPYAGFGLVPFDWQHGQPQKQRKNGADYYTGTVIVYTQVDFDNLWNMRAIVNVTSVGDGSQTVYIDSWQDPLSIQHALSMSSGAESHTAMLTDMQLDERLWRDLPPPTVVGLIARVEFLLLS